MLLFVAFLIGVALVVSIKNNTWKNEGKSLSDLHLALVSHDIAQVKVILNENNNLFSSLVDSINNLPALTLSEDESVYKKASLYLDIYYRLRLVNNLIQESANQNIRLHNLDIERLVSTLLKHSEKTKHLSNVKQNILATSLKALMLSDESNVKPSVKSLVEKYKFQRDLHSENEEYAKSILTALYLERLSEIQFLPFQESSDYLQFIKIDQLMQNENDLIRLLNISSQTQKIAFIDMIGFLTPKEGLNVLNFELIRSNKSENVQISLLRAITNYGSKARDSSAVLKRLMLITKNYDMRSRIENTLTIINGRDAS